MVDSASPVQSCLYMASNTMSSRLATALESAKQQASTLILQSLADVGQRCGLKAWAARWHTQC